ncbi:MAG: biopolymer transporter ExbD [Candidatus Aminicenantes bacterium]|jgi:biopolymer transport protein TolR
MVTKASPNVVPLCDILLVLLIIFMVITPMVQAGVDIRLPVAEGPPPPPGKPIVLTIEKEGLITVNKDEFRDLELLEKWLADVYRYRSDKTIFVQSHKHVLYKYVVKVIDLVKGVGVDNVCLMPQKSSR